MNKREKRFKRLCPSAPSSKRLLQKWSVWRLFSASDRLSPFLKRTKPEAVTIRSRQVCNEEDQGNETYNPRHYRHRSRHDRNCATARSGSNVGRADQSQRLSA